MIVSFGYQAPQWSPSHPYSKPLPELPEGWGKPRIEWSDLGRPEVSSTHTSGVTISVWNVNEEWESSAWDIAVYEAVGINEDQVVDVENYLNRVYERTAPAAYYVAEKALREIHDLLINSQLED